MDKRKQVLFSQPITNSGTTTALNATKGNLVPITSRKALTSRISSTDRIDQLGFKSKLKLSPISPRNTTAITMITEGKETLSSRSSIFAKGDSSVAQNNVKQTPNIFKNLTSNAVLHVTKKALVTAPSTPIHRPTNVIDNGTTQHIMNTFTSATKTTSNEEYSPTLLQTSLGINFRLICLYSNVITFNKDYEHSISKLRQVIDKIDIFTSREKCIEFLKTKTDEILFIVVSNDFAQSTIPLIHDMSQIHAIFIFCETKLKHKEWIKSWEKVENIFISIDSICEMLEQDIQQYHLDFPTIYVTNVELIRIDPSFLCTQLLKEIFVEMKFDVKSKKEFIQFYRQKQHVDNTIIDELEHNYGMHTPIWWYTRDCCLSDIINQAFRLQNFYTIIKMRFFIQDLHKQIEKLYKPPSEKLTLYRGQGLTHAHFEQLRTMQGGLFSFNSFLSASIDENVALFYADHSRHDSDLIGIVFQINIDPTTRISTPYASLDNENYHSDAKQEFLFAIHTIFRIGEMKQLDEQLWKIELSLTSNDDEDIRQINEYIRRGRQDSTGWDQLGRLLLIMGHFNKAEDVFQMLIQNSAKNDLKGLGYRYHQMGLVKKNTNFYKKAIIFYNKAIKMYQNCAHSNFSDFSTIHNDMGSLYQYTGEYAKALESYETALNIEKKSNPVNCSNLAIIYDNIAEVNKTMKQYSAALQYYQIILKIHKKCIPLNFQKLSATYKKIAEIHYSMDEYPQALKAFQKMLNIQQNYLSQNYIDMADIESNISQVYESMGEHSKASEHYENALKYCQMLLESHKGDVANLAIIYNSIASTYKNKKDYFKAIEFYRKTIEILKKFPHVTRPDLAVTCDNIGQMYGSIHDSKTALFAYRHAMQIEQQASPPNPTQLQLYQKHYHDGLTKGNDTFTMSVPASAKLFFF